MSAAERPQPELPIRRDRTYARCVWCRGENYMPAVRAYSEGRIPCAAVYSCGLYLPESYRRTSS